MVPGSLHQQNQYKLKSYAPCQYWRASVLLGGWGSSRPPKTYSLQKKVPLQDTGIENLPDGSNALRGPVPFTGNLLPSPSFFPGSLLRPSTLAIAFRLICAFLQKRTLVGSLDSCNGCVWNGAADFEFKVWALFVFCLSLD